MVSFQEPKKEGKTVCSEDYISEIRYDSSDIVGAFRGGSRGLGISASFFDGEEGRAGWDKETIRYAIRNHSDLCKWVRNVGKSMTKERIQRSDVDEILQDAMVYFHGSEDYDITKACTETGYIIAIDAYVKKCVAYCVRRYVTDKYNRNKDTLSASIVTGTEEKEVNLFDSIEDKDSSDEIEGVMFDIEEICRGMEPLRYAHGGVDIYLFMYIRLLALDSNMGDACKRILDIVGISNRDISNMNKKLDSGEELVYLLKAITLSGRKKSLEVLERYVYGVNIIKQALNNV